MRWLLHIGDQSFRAIWRCGCNDSMVNFQYFLPIGYVEVYRVIIFYLEPEVVVLPVGLFARESSRGQRRSARSNHLCQAPFLL